MKLDPNVFDVWVFQRRPGGVVFLLLYTSSEKATRHFNGGRFWQIPSDFVNDGESVTGAIERVLQRHALRPKSIWAGEHAYLMLFGRRTKKFGVGVRKPGGPPKSSTPKRELIEAGKKKKTPVKRPARGR